MAMYSRTLIRVTKKFGPIFLLFIAMGYYLHRRLDCSFDSSQNHFSTDTDRLGKQYPLQSVDDDKHPVVVFLHFAKVAGSYIQVLLQHWCAATNRSYFESLRPCPFKHCLTLQQMTASQRNEIDVIFGHLPFGIHDLFQLKRPIKYFILLRDPVRQAISAFNYDHFTFHPLAGVFQLQSIARTLNRTFHRQTPFSNQPTESIQLDHARNAVIGHLTGKHHNLEGVSGCLAGYGGSDGWAYAHNNSLAELQAMSTPTLVSFAQRVANQVHNPGGRFQAFVNCRELTVNGRSSAVFLPYTAVYLP